MNDYFQPLRRKIGVVTLVMACLLAALWVRSRSVADRVKLPVGESVVGIVDSDNYGICLRLDVGQGAPLRDTWFGAWCGLKNSKARNVDFVPIHYWLINVPLTLLSAYLLLSKPRTSKQLVTS